MVVHGRGRAGLAYGDGLHSGRDRADCPPVSLQSRGSKCLAGWTFSMSAVTALTMKSGLGPSAAASIAGSGSKTPTRLGVMPHLPSRMPWLFLTAPGSKSHRLCPALSPPPFSDAPDRRAGPQRGTRRVCRKHTPLDGPRRRPRPPTGPSAGPAGTGRDAI